MSQNASIGGIPPGASTSTGSTSIESGSRKNKDIPKTPTGNTPVAAKGSPFTRYLFKKTEPKNDQGSADTKAAELIKSPENPSDPQDTGAARLERF